MNILFVMIGGFFGSISRFALGGWIHTNNGFPLGTLIINLLGCFALGWFITFMRQKKGMKDYIHLMIGTGFLGSFTTFSTFSIEIINLIENSEFIQAVIYVFTSVIIGIFCSYLGWKLAVAFNKEDRTL